MENTSTISPEKSEHVKLFDPRETLDVDAIKRLRDTQKIVYEEAVEVHKENGYDQALVEHYARNVVDDSADLYLLGQGLTMDDPRYDEYKAGLNTVSILAVPEDEWVAAWDKTRNDGVLVLGQSGRDKTRALYTDLTGEMYLEAGVSPLTRSNETENNQPNDAHEALKEQLSGLRDNLASLSAKRQGNLLDVGIQKYDAALDEYNKKFTELARLELAEQIADDQLDQTQKNALVVQRYFEEEQTLRALTKEKMENTPVGKFVNWFTSGSKRQRFIRAGLIGVGAATVGALAGGVIGGIAGTAAVTAGAAATATGVSRFAKAYAKRDNKEGRGLSNVTTEHVSDAEGHAHSNSDTDVFRSVQEYFNGQLEADTKKEKLKRLRSVAFGLGAVAVGGTFATAVTLVAETGFVQHVYESTKDFIGGLGVDAQPSAETPTTYADDLREPLHLPVDHVPETSVEAPVVEAPVSDPNFTVGEGQGGIQFFQEKLGLSESQWNEIAGDLRKNFPDEFYDHGTEVRIQNSGGLSIPAQQFIKNRFGL